MQADLTVIYSKIVVEYNQTSFCLIRFDACGFEHWRHCFINKTAVAAPVCGTLKFATSRRGQIIAFSEELFLEYAHSSFDAILS